MQLGQVTARALPAAGLRVGAAAYCSVSLLALAVMFLPQRALADCGAPSGGTVICTTSDYTGGSISYVGIGGVNVIVNDPTLTITQSGTGPAISLQDSSATGDQTVTVNSVALIDGQARSAISVASSQGNLAEVTINAGTLTSSATFLAVAQASHIAGTGDSIVIMNGGLVQSTGGSASASGVLAQAAGGSATGNVLVSLTGGTIQTTAGIGARAVIQNSASTGTASVTISGGTIITTGGSATGASSTTNGLGATSVLMSNGSVSTQGASAYGLLSSITNASSTANVTVLLSGGTISTSGSSGYGLYSQATIGQAIVQITGGSVTTSGMTAFGANATATGAGTATVLLSGGSVTTTGGSAAGLRSLTVDGLATVQMTGGTVTANGPNSPGILASATGAGRYSVSVTGGTVTGGGTIASAIRAISSTGGTVVIGSGAIISGAASGIALDTTLGTGPVAITTAGTLTGAVNLGAAANTLDITGGSIAGNISGGGNTGLSFDPGSGGSFTYAAAYTISGASSLTMSSGAVKIDGTITAGALTVNAGTMTLTGANSFTGGTTLNGGVLSVASDANLGNAAGALNFNDGVLQVTGASFSGTARAMTWGANGGGFDIAAAANVFTVSQTLAGGVLTKLGAGTLVLTANDTFAGGTTISGGTLQIGSGTAGSITGNVTDNGVLAFGRSDAVSYGGVISGTGTVAQIAGGNLTLTGTNIYSGGTIISAGTITGSATSFGSGAITDNAMLVINQPTDAAFANAINGTGSFTKTGAGRLNYTGTGSLSGPTTVTAGLLSVNGSLASSAVTVQSGASLGGNGAVGATTIQSGGIIAPGNSIGTLHVNGAFVQNAGSIYQVEVDPNSNASDLIQVNGTATIQSGAGLNVIKYVPGEYQVGTIYKVLSASGGVTGTYTVTGQTTGVSAFLGLKDSYDANNAYLTVVQTQPLTNAASTPNQQTVAQALDALPPTAPVATAVLNLPDAPSARSALDQLSGSTQAAAKGAMISNGLYVRDVTFDRLRDVVCAADNRKDNQHAGCASDRPSVWAQGFGGWGGIAGNANAAGVNHSGAGMLVGVDVPVFDWRLGVFGGFSHADFHLVGANADGGSNDYHLGLYGGTRWDAFALRLGASYSWDGITTNRAVAFGTFTDQLRASYDAGTTQAFAEVGYRMDDDLWGVALEPFANLAYMNLGTSGFTEAGGPAALTVKGDRLENGVATLGVRPSTTVTLDGFDVTLRGMMGWRHIFGIIDPSATVSFAAGGSAFTVTGAPNARDVAALEAGLDVGLFENVRAGLTYGGQFSNRSTEQQARGTIRVNL